MLTGPSNLHQGKARERLRGLYLAEWSNDEEDISCACRSLALLASHTWYATPRDKGGCLQAVIADDTEGAPVARVRCGLTCNGFMRHDVVQPADVASYPETYVLPSLINEAPSPSRVVAK